MGNKTSTKNKEIKNQKLLYIVDELKDFPEEVLKKIEKAKIEKELIEKNFRVMINVMNFYFLGEKIFRTSEDDKKDRELKEQFKIEQQKLLDLQREVEESRMKRKEEQNKANDKTTSVSSSSVEDQSSSSEEEEKKKLNVHELQVREAEKLSILVENKNVLRVKFTGFNEEGGGGFGQVFRAQDTKSKQEVAIKKMSHRSAIEIRMNYSEIFLLEKCRHKNIVEFIEALVIPELGELWVVMEYLDGVDLAKAVNNTIFNENQIAFVSHQVLSALRFLHKIQIMHRDIKTENIMLTSKGEIKLIDFGFCRSMVEGPIVQTVGSPYFVSPEMINKKPHSYPADIWSFIISIIEIADSKPPHHDSPIRAMFYVGSGIMPKLQKSDFFSENMNNFINSCLVFDPEKRPSSEDLLKHPFVQNVDLKTTFSRTFSIIIYL